MRNWLVTAISIVIPIAGFAASPYVGEQSRSIKALSDQEIADYLAGKGMGFAKAAELNGFPGPSHVLELADELELSPTQKIETERMFARMQSRARDLGARLVDEERRLNELFASKQVSRQSLSKSLSEIASLQGQIRDAHLQAHLEQSDILSDAQARKYWQLRGYAAAGESPHRHKH